MRTRYLVLVLVIALWMGCRETDKLDKEITGIELEIRVDRFDREFANAGPDDLAALKDNYPFLFPAQYPDSIWIAKIQDSLQQELLKEIDKTFPTFDEQQQDLELLLKHIVYYFPDTKVPRVITLSSDVDYNNRIILADTLLLVGLDNYLGQDHRFYSGIDRYIAKELDSEYLISDVAAAYANKIISYPISRTFLSRMIHHGKILYLKDKWLPMATDGQKIHYTEEELAWAHANEEEIWRYFVERELLYSTDQGLDPRFLDPAPFSKFRLELDQESPGRLGRYMGWMIVRAFAARTELTPEQLIALPAEEIFKNSRYKPKK